MMLPNYDKWKLSDGLGKETVVAHCDQCSLEIYDHEEIYIVRANGDTIHEDCFDDYAVAALDAVIDLAKKLKEE